MNDGLMALFFLVRPGIEAEVLVGELASLKDAALRSWRPWAEWS